MAKMNNAWTEAGPDANGRLQLEGCNTWFAAMKRLKEERGDWIEPTDHSEADFAMVNAITPDQEGITQAEMWMVVGPWS
jgi:hypothetical protein